MIMLFLQAQLDKAPIMCEIFDIHYSVFAER